VTSPSPFENLLATAPVIMTGGSTYERFRRRTDVVSDPEIAHAALVYDDDGAALLAARRLLRNQHGAHAGPRREPHRPVSTLTSHRPPVAVDFWAA